MLILKDGDYVWQQNNHSNRYKNKQDKQEKQTSPLFTVYTFSISGIACGRLVGGSLYT